MCTRRTVAGEDCAELRARRLAASVGSSLHLGKGEIIRLFSLLGKLYCKECDSISLRLTLWWDRRKLLEGTYSPSQGRKIVTDHSQVPTLCFIRWWHSFLPAGCRDRL